MPDCSDRAWHRNSSVYTSTVAVMVEELASREETIAILSDRTCLAVSPPQQQNSGVTRVSPRAMQAHVSDFSVLYVGPRCRAPHESLHEVGGRWAAPGSPRPGARTTGPCDDLTLLTHGAGWVAGDELVDLGLELGSPRSGESSVLYFGYTLGHDCRTPW